MIIYPDESVMKIFFVNEHEYYPFSSDIRDIRNIFFRGLRGFISEKRIVVSSDYPYRQQLSPYIVQNDFNCNFGTAYFWTSSELLELIARLQMVSDDNVLVFVTDPSFVFFNSISKCPYPILRHLDGTLCHYSLEGKGEVISYVLQNLLDLLSVYKIKEYIVPQWISERLTTLNCFNVVDANEYVPYLQYVEDTITFREKLGTPQTVLPEDYYNAYYTFRDIEGNCRFPAPPLLNVPYYLTYDRNSVPTMNRILVTTGLMQSVIGMIEGGVNWLEFGCGGAQIANLTRPDLVGCNDFYYTGVDMNGSEIEWAKAHGGGLCNRCYLKQSAFSSLDTTVYNLFSAFEFIEHLRDPLSFLRNLNINKGSFFVAGTPLNEKIFPAWQTPHYWSFSSSDLTSIFKKAGFTILGTNELKFSEHYKCHDFITVVALKE
ncbi:MAG: class I SAM-dependent methyltransferase [Prevotella sp.]|jgi:hypothetical protein|nr:class I SAM-dependent methyltransferase [Prevotella sp.]